MIRPNLTRPLTRALVAVAAVALLATAATTPAGAATEARTFTVTGSITVGPPPALVLPVGTTVAFDFDTTTGAISNGVSTVPPFERGGTGPQATFVLSDATPFTGTIDPVTGETSVTFSYNVEVRISADVVCQLAGPVTLAMTTAGGAPLAGGVATLTATGFEIPAVLSGPNCPAEVADAANALFGTPTTDTAASFTVTESTPAPAPEPVPARPAFTG
jgi:hypothetical protein